jgi:hypothetical protein
MGISAKDNGNKAVVAVSSGDQTVLSNNGGQGFIYATHLTQSTNKQVALKIC